jgi:hypothetical protein
MKEIDRSEAFATMPIPQAVIKNVIPSIAGMLMVLVYNLADIFLSA